MQLVNSSLGVGADTYTLFLLLNNSCDPDVTYNFLMSTTTTNTPSTICTSISSVWASSSSSLRLATAMLFIHCMRSCCARCTQLMIGLRTTFLLILQADRYKRAFRHVPSNRHSTKSATKRHQALMCQRLLRIRF